MKKLVMMATIALVAFASCKKDEENKDDNTNTEQSANSMQYDGSSSGLVNAIVDDYGIWADGVYNLDILLIGEGFTVINRDSATGKGNLVYFEVFTGTEGSFETGTYSFDTTQAAGTFDIGEVIIGNDAATDEEEDFFLFTNGSLEIVSYSSSNLEMNFSGTLSNGKTVTGSYNGSFIYSDQSDEGMTTTSPLRHHIKP